MLSCLIRSNKKYGSKINEAIQRKAHYLYLHNDVVAIEKGAFVLPSTTISQLLYYYYIIVWGLVTVFHCNIFLKIGFQFTENKEQIKIKKKPWLILFSDFWRHRLNLNMWNWMSLSNVCVYGCLCFSFQSRRLYWQDLEYANCIFYREIRPPH